MYDELELDTLGDQKTALFLVMSDTDATFNFLISMIYTRLFNLLCDQYHERLTVLYYVAASVDTYYRIISK